MPGKDAIRAAMNKGNIASDISLSKLAEADAALGAVDGTASGDLGIGPTLVFRPQGATSRAITQEHLNVLSDFGLVKPDVTLAEIVDDADEAGLINGAAELVGPWFALRQMPTGDIGQIVNPQ